MNVFRIALIVAFSAPWLVAIVSTIIVAPISVEDFFAQVPSSLVVLYVWSLAALSVAIFGFRINPKQSFSCH